MRRKIPAPCGKLLLRGSAHLPIMQIEKRSMNWLPRASLYREAEAARLKRKANAEAYLSQQSSNASAFTSLNTSAAGGAVDLTFQIAVARVRSGSKPKV